MLVSFLIDQSASTNENDLNRGETKDTKPYVKNITDDNGKKSNEDGGEISAEEINKIMEETSEECELEARRALKNLEKDKNIMKRLQEIKGRQNEDVNKQGKASKRKGKDFIAFYNRKLYREDNSHLPLFKESAVVQQSTDNY